MAVLDDALIRARFRRARAWRRYLRSTRGLVGDAYAAGEVVAWGELRSELAEIAGDVARAAVVAGLRPDSLPVVAFA